MEELTIAVSDCSEAFLYELESVIRKASGLRLIGAVGDGNEMYRLIQQKEPDVAVIDLVMTGMDGFSLLERLKKDQGLYKRPKVILTSHINHDRIIQDAFQLGASYFLLKPFHPQILPERIRQVAHVMPLGDLERELAVTMVETAPVREEPGEKESLTAEALQVLICDYLCRMGVPAHIKGYRYLGSAIEMCVRDISLVERVTKTLYPQIAQKYCSAPSRVERAIRHAIEVAWSRGPADEQNEVFGCTINLQKGRPTNSEFIAMLASRIRLQYRV